MSYPNHKSLPSNCCFCRLTLSWTSWVAISTPKIRPRHFNAAGVVQGGAIFTLADLAFAAASAVMLAIPGPTILLVISYALGQGWRTAFPIAVGVALGDFTAMTLSMLGVGALLATSALVFTTLKWIGAAYLVWLGIKLFRAGGTLVCLRGVEFFNFGAFFSRAYRENDYLFGRLHAAERLVDIVATAVPEAAVDSRAWKGRLFAAILASERARLGRIGLLFDELEGKLAIWNGSGNVTGKQG